MPSSPRTPLSAISCIASLLWSLVRRRRTASVTPPVTPKITPPPEPNPNGISQASGSRSENLIPKLSIIRSSSVVVITISVSCSPLVKLFGRTASAFFAVHGMMETITVFFPCACSGSRKYSLMTAESIPCGERQVDRFGI